MCPRPLRTAAVALTLTAALGAGGCVADPPPPAAVGEEAGDAAEVRQLAGGVSLALTRLDEGLNPHLLADQGADTDLFAELTLPSAFRTGPDGTRVPDGSLLESATVLSRVPFVVRYTLRGKAQWSDGVPVGAEDFAYLWRQMRTQPGVVDPEGYDRVVDVRSGAGGKMVDVQFDAPFERWQTLFSHLVPAHLLKDAPGGFQEGLRRGAAASAGPFMVRTADLGRGVVELVRNDRYWDTPPDLDQIVVRRVAGAQSLGQSLRSGPGSVGLVTDTEVDAAVVSTVPGMRSGVASATGQLELGFGLTSAAGSDEAVRRAVVAAVDPRLVGRIATGIGDPPTTTFPFPAGTGEARTPGPPADPAALLRSAGYERVGSRWTRGGVPLSLTIGVATGDPIATVAAYTVLDQLHAAGVGARVWELPAVDLYADALPHGLVDAVVSRQRTDGDPVVAAVSRYRCAGPEVAGAPTGSTPSRTAVTRTGLQPPPVDPGADATTPASSTSPTPTPTRRGEPGASARASGVAGVCDPALDEALAAASVDRDPDEALRRAGRRVTELALRVPLVRPRHLVAHDQSLSGVPVPGPGQPALFDTEIARAAPQWRRE